MRERFEQIYANNEWQYGSGEGSLVQYVKPYIEFLQQFLRTHSIRRVLDFGCGDWQFSRFIDWAGINYLGLDLVTDVIQDNQTQYGSETISFALLDSLDVSLPSADLLIIKDVMQHWSNESIWHFLPQLANYPYCLIINCIQPDGMSDNREIQDGGFRYLDLRVGPFYLKTQELMRFSNGSGQKLPWVKSVQLLRGHEFAEQGLVESERIRLRIDPISPHILPLTAVSQDLIQPVQVIRLDEIGKDWPWTDNSIHEVYFEQSLEQSSQDNELFMKSLQELYRVCAPGARVYLYARHPHSPAYRRDPHCKRMISPELFSLLSRRNNRQWQAQGLSFSALALQYQINFELLETEYILSPPWQLALNQGQVSQNQVMDAMIRQQGVLDAFKMTLVIDKDPISGTYSAPMPK